MALSWNEIKDRASKFSKEWENDFNEKLVKLFGCLESFIK